MLRMDKGKAYPFDYFFEKEMKEREDKHKKQQHLFDESSSEDEASDPDTMLRKEALNPETEEKICLSLKLGTTETAEEPDCQQDCDDE